MSVQHESARWFVGREREMGELGRALGDALSSRGRLVLLAGEPGIGKSRTAEEIAALAAERGAEVLVGRCYDDETASILSPWVQILGGLARNRDDRELAAVLGAEASDVAPLLPRTGPPAGVAPSPGPDTEPARSRVLEAIAAVLGRVARLRPVVLLLDDLDGADPSSLLLLRIVARRLREMPALVVGTFRDVALSRDDLLAETLAELLREPVTTSITLRGLNETEVARFIEAASGRAPAPELAARVHERSQGNPLFVGEIARWLVESEGLDDAGREIDVAGVAGVRAAVARQIGRLSGACAAMLRLASGFGREFRADALARAAGAGPELAALLGEALAARVIGEIPDRPGHYRFAHAITRDVLRDEVPAPHRPDVHRRLAEALEAVAAAEAEPPLAELGALFRAANDPRGIDYLHRAGDRALETSAHEEPVQHYGGALALLDSTMPGDDETRCELLIALARAHNRADAIAAAQGTALEAAANARRRFARDQLGRAALAFSPRFAWGETRRIDAVEVALLEEALALWPEESDSPLHVKLLARLATVLCHAVDAAERRAELSERAVAMARRLEDRASLVHALLARHLAVWSPENAEERTRIATEVVQIGESLRSSPIAFEGHFWRFCDGLELGDAAALKSDFVACLRLADPRDPLQASQVVSLRVTRALVAGRAEEAEALVTRLRDSGARCSPRFAKTLADAVAWGVLRQRGGSPAAFRQLAAPSSTGHPLHRCVLVAVNADAGRTADARSEYAAFVPHGLAHLPSDPSRGLALVQLAEACHALGDEAGAEALYEALTPYESRCVAVGTVGFFGAVSLPLGVLATMRRQWAKAERHFAQALAVHRRMRAAPWIARTRCEHAAMLLARGESGDGERARALLAEARPEAEALGMSRLLSRVDALIAQAREALGGPGEGGLEDPGQAGRRPIEITEPEPAPEAQNGAGGATSPRDEEPGNVFRREGEYWTIVYAGAPIRLRDTKGLHYIAHLLAHPARDIHVADLAALGSGPGMEAAAIGSDMGPEGDAGALLDRRAAAEYRSRLADLREELDEAVAGNDTGRAERIRHEIEMIARELSGAYGLGGRQRRAGDPGERMRKAVTNQIRRALERIRAEHPALGRHLGNALRTGFLCAYTPEQPVEWGF